MEFVPKANRTASNTGADATKVIVDSRYLAATAPVVQVATETQTENVKEGKSDSTAAVLGDTDVNNDNEIKAANEYLVLMIAGSVFLLGGSVFAVRRFIF